MINTSNKTRPTWDEYFMMAAKLIAVMATCPKLRVGTVIVKNKRIISSGFNGAPAGHPHCMDVGCMIFEDEGSSCRRVIHSEHNAILQNSKDVAGGSLYTPYMPCIDCMKPIVASGISEVIFEKEYQGYKQRYQMSKELASQAGIKLKKIPEVSIVDILGNFYKGQEALSAEVAYTDKEEEVLEFVDN